MSDFSNLKQSVEFQKNETREVIVKNGQSLLDIAIQESGNIESYLDIAEQNNIRSLDVEITGEIVVIHSQMRPGRLMKNKPSTGVGYAGSTYGEYEITEYNNEEYNV